MADLNPVTNGERLLNSIANGEPSNVSPKTRREHYLSAIAGETDLPEKMQLDGPLTNEEIYYQKILDNGGAGGGEATGTKTINITANGTTTHNVKAYATAQIITNVPNPSTGTKQISQNGTHDVTDYASAQVNVPNSYASSDEGKVVSNGALASQTSRQVTANGTYDTTLNSSVEVAVPASGITPTGTKNITTNGDHDVTNFATAHVDVPTGITPSGSQEFTQNGTYDVTSLAEAVVNVEGSSEDTLLSYLKGTFNRPIIDDTVLSVPAYFSYRHGGITGLNIPNCELLGNSAFYLCGTIQYCFAPNAMLDASALYGTQVVTCVSKAARMSTANSQFRAYGDATKKLNTVDFTAKASGITSEMFRDQANFTTLILREEVVYNLSYINAFQGTPFASGGTGGTIYIPKALYDHLGDGSSSDYKASTNWATIDGYGTITWMPIEGSIYETQYGDGTPISS